MRPVATVMQFNHPVQHTLARLAEAEAEWNAGPVEQRRVLGLANNLLSHGHPAAREPIARLAESAHADVRKFASTLRKADRYVRQIFRYEALAAERKRQFYQLDRAMFLPKPGAQKLLVVLTTMYNNLYVSNAILAAIAERLPCSLLLLKDSTLLNYFGGVEGLAADLPDIGRMIGEVARGEGLRDIYLCGYSSSGYATLFLSMVMPCRACLVFSPATDLSAGSLLPPPKFFTPPVRNSIDPALLTDLKAGLEKADPAIARTVYYGRKSTRDAAHGDHLLDAANVDLRPMSQTGHNTILPFLANGTFAEELTTLLER